MSSHKYSIEEGKELRIQFYENEAFTITVNNGQCEVNGCELSGSQEFVNHNFAVYAWFNTSVVIEGRVKNAYVAEDSKTPLYFDIHKQIQVEREKVSPYNVRVAPKVLVLGNKNSGKFTLSQTLLGYGARCGETMLYLDLDVSSGNISIPGSLSALVVDREHHIRTNAQKCILSPLVKYFGSTSCLDNVELFSHNLHALFTTALSRFNNDDKLKHGGIICNCGSWYKEEGARPLLNEVMNLLQPDLVLVIHDEQVYSELKERYPSCTIEKIPLSGGVVLEDEKTEGKYAISEYFYGPVYTTARLARNNTLTRNFAELPIYKFPQASSMVDGSGDVMFEPRKVKLEEMKSGTILALTDAKTESELKDASILAFIFVSNVDLMNKVVDLNTTFDGDLPDTLLLKGSVEWNK